MFTPAKFTGAFAAALAARPSLATPIIVPSGGTLKVEVEGGNVQIGLTRYSGGWKVMQPAAPATNGVREFTGLAPGTYFVNAWNIASPDATDDQKWNNGLIMTDTTIKWQYGAHNPRAPWIEVK